MSCCFLGFVFQYGGNPLLTDIIECTTMFVSDEVALTAPYRSLLTSAKLYKWVSCANPESLSRGGSTPTLQTFFFKLMKGEMVQISLEAGHHRTNDGPTLNADLVDR